MDKEGRILIKENGVELLVDAKKIFEKLGVLSVIRIHESEYGNIDTAQKYFTHFNLGSTPHQVGARYALAKILRPGYARGGDVVLPLLSFENICYGECIEVGNNIEYTSLHKDIFEYSMCTIKDIDSLKQEMFRRYHLSRPELSDDNIVSLGVAYTKLRLV